MLSTVFEETAKAMDAGMFFIFTFNINPRVQGSSLCKVSKLWSTDHLHENLLESFKNMYILRLQHRPTESESLEKRGPGNMHLTSTSRASGVH